MNVNEDLSYAFALSRQCLRLLGVWPDPRVPVSDFRRPSLRFMIVLCILSFYVIIPQLTNMIRAWGNVTLMVQHIASANFSLMANCKLVITLFHSETLRTLMISVTDDWITSKNTWERDIMLKIARRGRSLSFRCYIMAAGAVGCYVCLNLIKFYRSMHKSQRPIVYWFPYPYNVQKSPNYELTFFIQLSGGAYTALINCTVDSFVSILVLHICAQLKILRKKLNRLVDQAADKSASSSKFKESLIAIATRHEHLIRFVRQLSALILNAKTIDKCYSDVLLLHMLALTFQLCFQTFQVYTIITDRSDVPIFKLAFLSFYAVVVLMNMYIYCYSAERLVKESTDMAYSVYECKWYDLPSKDAKDLMFIVYRSAHPLILTAGKFGMFSIEMFGTTLKTSMGYLSALLTMKD